jgi:peptidyl-prolyl cis-trans isomerase A (cyclophilin A)
MERLKTTYRVIVAGMTLIIGGCGGDESNQAVATVSSKSTPGLSDEERREGYKSLIGSSSGETPDSQIASDQTSAAPDLGGDSSCPSSVEITDSAILDLSQWQAEAPQEYTVVLDTTGGEIHISVNRSWAPRGADRFYNLVSSGYLTEISWFRVVPGFVAQAGMHGNPQIHKRWSDARIEDDPVVESNTRGMVTFATSGPNSRSNQFFINFGDNKSLDGQGFAPFGRVVEGMDVVDAIESKYGQSPKQGQIQSAGAAYLCSQFPDLDRILSARVVEDE